MPDSTREAIDRFFDVIDRGVDNLDHAFNRGQQVEEKHRARRTKRPEVIEAEATVKPTKKSSSSTVSTTAIARKPTFRIVESITPTGTLYVVTDGGNARTECSTRSFAEQVLRALEGSS